MKKTNYPDLERLPSHNFWKHLLNYIWNKPRWIFENFCDKCFFTIKKCKKAELEFIPKYTTGEMFRESYDWFINNHQSINKDEKVSAHRKPMKEALLKVLRWIS